MRTLPEHSPPTGGFYDLFRAPERPVLSSGIVALDPARATRYAARALEDECQAVADAVEGTRNHTLNRAAYSIGQLVAAGHLEHDDAWNGLAHAATAAGLGTSEIDATLRSGLAAGMQEPRTVPELPPRPEPSLLHVAAAGDDDPGTRSALPPLVPLVDLLAEPDEAVTYRLEGLLPSGGRALLAAQFKAGKTTLRDNLVRSLADAQPFLDAFDVTPLGEGRTVVVLDNEMSRPQLRRWLRDQGIRHPDRVRVVVLRGQVATFNILDPFTRAAWAELLREAGAGFLVFDCLRPVLDALGLDESRDAGRFLVAFDALLREAGVDEAALVHHMGHTGERSRGDSRLRDWPDVEWRVVRQTRPHEEPDPSAPRFFSAYGRDVDVPESALTYDPLTRRLTLGSGSRRDVTARDALPAVLDVLEQATEPLTQNAVEAALRGSDHGRPAIRKALRLGRDEGLIHVRPGPRNASLHSLRTTTQHRARRTQSDCATAPIGGAVQSEDEEPTTTTAQGGAVERERSCDQRSHSPRLVSGAWTCPDCEREEAGA